MVAILHLVTAWAAYAQRIFRRFLHSIEARIAVIKHTVGTGLKRIRHSAISYYRQSRFFAARIVYLRAPELVQYLVCSSEAIAAELGTLIGVIVGSFVAFAPDWLLRTEVLNTTDVHVASSAIIGTALALVISLAVVPAQRAAEAFSPAILRLYARDKVILTAFSFLALFVALSMLFASGAVSILGSRAELFLQFAILGASFDKVRSFHSRTLSLLTPSTALEMVRSECARVLSEMNRRSYRLGRVLRQSPDSANLDEKSRRFLEVKAVDSSSQIVWWNSQIEEFAVKAIGRGDSHAAKLAVATMAGLAASYADIRRDSIGIDIDWSSGMPVTTSDLNVVWSPVQESIQRLGSDAIRSHRESVVMLCLASLGDLCIQAFSVREEHEFIGVRAPLAFGAIYHLGIFALKVSSTELLDAQLTAVRSIARALNFDVGKIDNRNLPVEEHESLMQAIDTLARLAVSGYRYAQPLIVFPASETLLQIAHHAIRHSDMPAEEPLETVLNKIYRMMDLEILADAKNQRTLQVFPAYSMTFASSLDAILATSASKIPKVDPKRAWVDPYHDFSRVSEVIRHHFYEVGRNIDLRGTLTKRWILDAILASLQIHVRVLRECKGGALRFESTLVSEILGYIHLPGWYFSEPNNRFTDQSLDVATDGIAFIALELLELGKHELVVECLNCISGIGRNAVDTSVFGYTLAEALLNLEIIARASDHLGAGHIAVEARRRMNSPDKLSGADLATYLRCLATRMAQLDDRLRRHRRARINRFDPIVLLQDLLHP